MSKGLAVPASARQTHDAATSLGFRLIRKTGKCHLVYAKDGVPGVVVTSGTPKHASSIAKVVADCKRLIKRVGK